jgi:uncharacterized protein (DUF1499 family)
MINGPFPTSRCPLWIACLFQLLIITTPAYAETPTMPNTPLSPCPSSPNCVSSDAATDDDHWIEPYSLLGEPATAWRVLLEVVASLPRTTVTTQTSDYLRAESKSALFGFVDDLELQWRPADQIIAVRSASRVGYWDWGVNRRRVEQIRTRLRERGVIQ